jgi:hypothetical protein
LAIVDFITDEELKVRFWAKVRKCSGDGCWPWTGGKISSKRPYGVLQFNRRAPGERRGVYLIRKSYKAHRISWQIHFGPIPDGLFVCHKCDNPPCVRPDHLFLGTALENRHDAMKKGRLTGPTNSFGGARLTENQVREIRQLAADHAMTYKQLCAKYGVTQPTIWEIIKRHSWRHVA